MPVHWFKTFDDDHWRRNDRVHASLPIKYIHSYFLCPGALKYYRKGRRCLCATSVIQITLAHIQGQFYRKRSFPHLHGSMVLCKWGKTLCLCTYTVLSKWTLRQKGSQEAQKGELMHPPPKGAHLEGERGPLQTFPYRWEQSFIAPPSCGLCQTPIWSASGCHLHSEWRRCCFNQSFSLSLMSCPWGSALIMCRSVPVCAWHTCLMVHCGANGGSARVA